MSITVARTGITINGAKLRKSRIAARLGTAALAEAVGCEPGHIRLMERGLRRPSIEMLGAIEKALEISAEQDLDAELPT